MADISATLSQFSTYLGESVTALFSLLSNLATFFALATGLASLFFGRRLFWIFVATIGFIIGTHVAPLIYPSLPEVMVPFQDVIGLAIALVLAGTAIVMQRFATIIFGALAMGIVGYMIAGSADSIEWVQWFFTALFALSGGLLLYFFFDWTLIIVSVLVGSAIAIFGARTTGGIPDDYGLWLFGLLLAAGLIYQGNDLRIASRLRQGSASKQDGAAKQDGAPIAAPQAMPPSAAMPRYAAPLAAQYPSTAPQAAPQSAPASAPYQGTSYSGAGGGNTVMVPLKPAPSDFSQRAYQPDFAPMTAYQAATGSAAGAATMTAQPPSYPAPQPSTFVSPTLAQPVQAQPVPAQAQSAQAKPSATLAPPAAKRVELFPGYPAASFPVSYGVADARADGKGAAPSIYSAEYEQVAPAFPPTFASSHTQAKLAPSSSATVAPAAVATTTPDAMAPTLNAPHSMSFSDLWKWTPWRKNEVSGTVSGSTKQGAASQGTGTAQTHDKPFHSSPDALG